MKATFGRVIVLAGAAMAVVYALGFGQGFGNGDWITGLSHLFGGVWAMALVTLGIFLALVAMKMQSQFDQSPSSFGIWLYRIAGWYLVATALAAAILVTFAGAGWFAALTMLVVSWLFAGAISERVYRQSRANSHIARFRAALKEAAGPVHSDDGDEATEDDE